MHRTPASSEEPPLWRAAFPLFAVAAVSFVVAYVVARDATHTAFGHLPLWGFFAAVGAVITGGGVTVLVAGRTAEPEERAPFYDPREYVLVPRARYEHLVAVAEPPEAEPEPARAPAPAPRSTLPAWSEQEPMPTRPVRVRAPAPEAPTPRTRPSARTGFAPSPEFLPQVDAAIGEMEHLLEELREKGAQEARILGKPEPRPPPSRVEGIPPTVPLLPPPPPPSPPRAGPRATKAEAGTAAFPPLRPAGSSAPAIASKATKPDAPVADLNTCITCGEALPVPARAHRCSVCGGPMCTACLGRARRAGHTGVCSRCASLLPTSDRDAAPGAPARPTRRSR